MSAMRATGRLNAKTRREGVWEFRLIFAASFLVFLFIAAVERLLPRRQSAPPMARRPRKSIFAEAREAASTYVPYAFMG